MSIKDTAKQMIVPTIMASLLFAVVASIGKEDTKDISPRKTGALETPTTSFQSAAHNGGCLRTQENPYGCLIANASAPTRRIG